MNQVNKANIQNAVLEGPPGPASTVETPLAFQHHGQRPVFWLVHFKHTSFHFDRFISCQIMLCNDCTTLRRCFRLENIAGKFKPHSDDHHNQLNGDIITLTCYETSDGYKQRNISKKITYCVVTALSWTVGGDGPWGMLDIANVCIYVRARACKEGGMLVRPRV